MDGKSKETVQTKYNVRNIQEVNVGNDQVKLMIVNVLRRTRHAVDKVPQKIVKLLVVITYFYECITFAIQISPVLVKNVS